MGDMLQLMLLGMSCYIVQNCFTTSFGCSRETVISDDAIYPPWCRKIKGCCCIAEPCSCSTACDTAQTDCKACRCRGGDLSDLPIQVQLCLLTQTSADSLHVVAAQTCALQCAYGSSCCRQDTAANMTKNLHVLMALADLCHAALAGCDGFAA